MSPTADESALAWARALAEDVRRGQELDWLERLEGVEVDVVCRTCGRLFLTLAPSGDRASVVPAVGAHASPDEMRRAGFGTRFVPDSPRDSAGYPLTTWERVKLLCPCGQKSPTVTARTLARRYLYALARGRDLLWPPD